MLVEMDVFWFGFVKVNIRNARMKTIWIDWIHFEKLFYMMTDVVIPVKTACCCWHCKMYHLKTMFIVRKKKSFCDRNSYPAIGRFSMWLLVGNIYLHNPWQNFTLFPLRKKNVHYVVNMVKLKLTGHGL